MIIKWRGGEGGGPIKWQPGGKKEEKGENITPTQQPTPEASPAANTSRETPEQMAARLMSEARNKIKENTAAMDDQLAKNEAAGQAALDKMDADIEERKRRIAEAEQNIRNTFNK